MHGLLRRLFAPRWQHPNAEVRRQALHRLDPDHREQRQALASLAQDPDSDIQLAALIALDDLEGLMAAYPAHQNDMAWQEALCQRLSGQQGQTGLGQREALAERIDDTKILNALVHKGDNLNLRLTALARLTDERDLIEHACHNGVAAVRHQAADRIVSQEGLKQLLKQARRDRQVVRMAKDRLQERRADAEWKEAQQQKRETLLQQLERHAQSTWEPLYGGRLRHLQREWDQLSQSPDPDQEARYHQAVLACRKTLHDHETHEQARQQNNQQREATDQTREQLLEGLEETLEGLRLGSGLTSQDIDSLRAQRQLLGQRWQQLSDVHPPSDSIRQRYTQALKEYEACIEAWQRWQRVSAELEQALADADHSAISSLLDQCRWPDTLTMPTLARQAQEALDATHETADTQTDAQSLSAYSNDLDTFEQLLERGAFKSASRLHQRLKPRIEALKDDDARPLKARLKQLGAQLAELRDWRGFVAGPKREQLCASIEVLADDQHMAEPALDRHHRQLVKEWKSLGDAAADRELSARFRAASDRIHERLAPWRERLTQQREANLRAREALCEQLETLLAQPAQDADPDVLREIRDKARQQWRHHSPVPREQAEAIGRRFGRARHQLQSLIDTRAEHIADQKKALISSVQALHQDERPLAERIEDAKQLQQQWRQLGRAPKGEEQTLWKAFRHECDQLFARRDAHKQEQLAQQQRQLDSLQALVDEMDSWQPQDASDHAKLDAFIEQATRLEPLPRSRRSEGMQRRLSGIIRARRERLNRLEVAGTVTAWQQLTPLIEAHLRADQRRLVDEQADTVDAQAVLGETSLKAPFEQAHHQRNQRRMEGLPNAHEANLKDQLARLRVHLSLLAMGRVHQQDEPLRLAIQVERLNEGLQKERSRAQEVSEVLADLIALGPMPRSLWDQEVDELDELLTRLAQTPTP
ncbi:DUF349 domain-containing protein [Halomonas janggokensis]|uniref:DUF349 domain-containing protein n=1 Tax=Vreelandella janggokensis TaxID=370767 RepID=A0ABT4IY74_9GAMM|nr:DUF349 domain-containing protein [Halomonas janggokensis]MCZ0928638.1 DUF349 domain-containing protein [Halomonas janggokensis]MCZ0931373.1 DUF349 domain-containing protein [Halomonas janggokensis]